VRKQKKEEAATQAQQAREDPQFNKSLKMFVVEQMGGVISQQPENPEAISEQIQANFSKPNHQYESQFILANNNEVGPGTGF